MKRNRKVTAENGQEIEVSLLVDGGGIHVLCERLGQDEGSKTLSISLNQSGIEIENSFPDSIDPTEETAITAAITDFFEEIDPFSPAPQE